MATIATTFRLNDEVSNGMNRIADSVRNTTRGFESLGGKLVVLNSALDLMGKAIGKVKEISSKVFGELIGNASNYENILSSLTVTMGDATLAQEEFGRMKKLASETPFNIPDVAQASIMLRNVGVEAEKIIPTIKMLGDSAQGDAVKFNSILANYVQIMSIGKASEMDIKQFSNALLPIRDVLKEMGVEGPASAEQIEEAFRRMTSAGGTFYNGMNIASKTLTGKLSTLQDEIEGLASAFGGQIMSTLRILASRFTIIIQKFQETKIFEHLMVKVKEVSSFIMHNLDSIIATMINVGTVATIVGTVMATAWMVAHWPITLVIVAITTIIRLMFDLTKSSNDACETMTGGFNQVSQSLATLGSVLGGIGSFFGGLMNIIYNFFILIYNSFMTVCEMFMNLPNLILHPIQTIKKFFIDMAIMVLESLSAIGSGIDFIFGSKISETMNNAVANLRAFERKVAPDMYYYDKAEMKDVNSFWSGAKKGANFGAEMGALIDQNLKFTNNAWAGDNIPDKYKNYMQNRTLAMPDIPLENIGELKFDSNGNLKTTVQNEIKINDEFKQLLAQKAVEDYKMKYARGSTTVTFGDININDRDDVDYIVDSFVDSFVEKVDASLMQ